MAPISGSCSQTYCKANIPVARPNGQKFFGEFNLDLRQARQLKRGDGLILCITYTLRAFGSITFGSVKIENFGMRTIVQASEQLCPRSMVKTPESCTTDGTTQIIDYWQNGNTLVFWRNDVERKIVMISLQRPVSWNGNLKRIECEQAKRLDAGDASRARLP